MVYKNIKNACGIDIHKKLLVATIMCEKVKKQTLSFGTTTEEILKFKKWILENEITHLAIESTGPYWIPVYNLLEDYFEVQVINARHIKNVPGRKTDVNDSEWICHLLKSGLLSPSLILPREFRALKELVRYRKKLIQARSAEKNRIQKVLETANIKITSFLTDLFGKSGRNILNYILENQKGNFPKLFGKVKDNKAEIQKAIVGCFDEYHKIMIKKSLNHIDHINEQILDIEKSMKSKMEKYDDKLKLLKTIPGISEISAMEIISTIGIDMSKFPSKNHIASWAGLCPGNNQSAGKIYSGRITHGDKFLKSTLVEVAWAASRTKNIYLSSKFKQLKFRIGTKKALIAIAHKIIISIYECLRKNEEYKELGENFLLDKKKKKITSSYVKKLTNLGYNVQISPRA